MALKPAGEPIVLPLAPPAAFPGKEPCGGPKTPAVSGSIDERVPGFLRWLETKAGRVPVISLGSGRPTGSGPGSRAGGSAA